MYMYVYIHVHVCTCTMYVHSMYVYCMYNIVDTANNCIIKYGGIRRVEFSGACIYNGYQLGSLSCPHTQCAIIRKPEYEGTIREACACSSVPVHVNIFVTGAFFFCAALLPHEWKSFSSVTEVSHSSGSTSHVSMHFLGLECASLACVEEGSDQVPRRALLYSH